MLPFLLATFLVAALISLVVYCKLVGVPRVLVLAILPFALYAQGREIHKHRMSAEEASK